MGNINVIRPGEASDLSNGGFQVVKLFFKSPSLPFLDTGISTEGYQKLFPYVLHRFSMRTME